MNGICLIVAYVSLAVVYEENHIVEGLAVYNRLLITVFIWWGELCEGRRPPLLRLIDSFWLHDWVADRYRDLASVSRLHRDSEIFATVRESQLQVAQHQLLLKHV